MGKGTLGVTLDTPIRGVPVEDNTASECIRTVTATYCCKILQLHEYEKNESEAKNEYEAKCE